jgi:hypothetical protein
MLGTEVGVGSLLENHVQKYSKVAPVIGCVLCAVFGAGSVLADAAPTNATHDSGVWQRHQYSFTFMGFTTTYSCDGLADKLQLLLIASGARADAKAQAGACASGFGRPDKFAQADLTFYTLAPTGDASGAPPAGSPPAAAPTAKSPAATAPAATVPVPATWRAVALAARNPRELATGDCELVEQFRNNVLPMFTTRNVQNQTTCIPHQDSGSVINLKFESLSAVPRKHMGPVASNPP